jgi:hypothetical protein
MRGGEDEKAINENISKYHVGKVLRRSHTRDAGIVHDRIVIWKKPISIHPGGENDFGRYQPPARPGHHHDRGNGLSGPQKSDNKGLPNKVHN